MKYHKQTKYRKQHQRTRASAAVRGYGRRWQRYRLHFLVTHPLCQGYTREANGQAIHAKGCPRYAQHVDHIKPVSGAEDPLFWEPSNHQGLSHRCHATKTAREDGGLGNRKVSKCQK